MHQIKVTNNFLKFLIIMIVVFANQKEHNKKIQWLYIRKMIPSLFF